jgi:hypothetical protein
LLAIVGQNDASMGAHPPAMYAGACRWTEGGFKRILETCSHILRLGQPLPTLPLWLADDLYVPLELAATYEETCRVLRIA